MLCGDGWMRDTELYRHLLGLVAPWEVSHVELSVDGGRVDVWAEHPRLTRSACPECDVEGASRLLHLSWDEAWHLMDWRTRQNAQ